MRTFWCSSVAALLIGLTASPASAGLCQAPFMHNGGQVQLTGSGGLQLGADLAFSEVSKQGDDHCDARVQGTATYGLAGLPPGKSTLDYWMTVRNGQASFERPGANGTRVAADGRFDLRMLGLFAYGEPISRSGQTFPELNFQINLDKKKIQTQPIVVHTGVKTVGERQTMQTAAGQQSCWPINYTRRIEATQASFNGLVLPIPAMTASVTDWFCPDLNMVMRQDSKQNGVSSVVEVTKIK
ncbi:hypothetical protein [Pollutimonas harenae]|uniref:DUF3108 domain-containing protein n=1 Tax=Pollutimonas harenae TaxID=657015 RepID=A0A853H4T4_9BURK|nr:hypothetical protein [Pollutimonas harenae]NYT87030.1 hypothetical protein [Pollutimonas harenae]TEA69247.1 hypothetical protein ERD84_15820 [Pollutimonas harenae]